MSTRASSGVLLWRWAEEAIEVLCGHMGGPYWSRKDDGAWTIPKGLVEPGEDPLAAAEREFAEELGQPPPPPAADDPDIDLGTVKGNGKHIRIFARHGDLDPDAGAGTTFTMEWPPKSGRRQEFPEVDRAAWFPLAAATDKLTANQRAFIARLAAVLDHDQPPAPTAAGG